MKAFFVNPVDNAIEVAIEDNAGGLAVVMSFPLNEAVEAGVCAKRLNMIVDQELKAANGVVLGKVV